VSITQSIVWVAALLFWPAFVAWELATGKTYVFTRRGLKVRWARGRNPGRYWLEVGILSALILAYTVIVVYNTFIDPAHRLLGLKTRPA